MPRSKNPRKFAGRPPKHGARLLQRVLREGKLDERTALARIRRDLRRELIDDLGGEARTSAAQRHLIDRIVFHVMVCGAIEEHTLSTGTPLAKDGSLLPALAHGYATYSAAVARMAVALGLRPDRAAKLPDLATYLADRAANAQNTAQDAHTAVLNDFPRATAADTPDDADAAGEGADDAEDEEG